MTFTDRYRSRVRFPIASFKFKLSSLRLRLRDVLAAPGRLKLGLAQVQRGARAQARAACVFGTVGLGLELAAGALR